VWGSETVIIGGTTALHDHTDPPQTSSGTRPAPTYLAYVNFGR